jgi:CDP-paratose 2-epimerase
MRYLITGGCGFLGSNLARRVLEQGHSLVIYDNLSRLGSERNLEWLKTLGDFEFVRGDIRDQAQVEALIRCYTPEVIFHLAGQVAMTTSLQNPRADFEINAMGTLNVLEAIRQFSPQTLIVYSSTNKVYGDLEWTSYTETETRYVAPEFPYGFPETITLSFESPYGCSKGSADQYILDYARLFGVRGIVFRHSSMFGGRQFSTYDQGWIGWFCQKALEIQAGQATGIEISGNGKQVRDVLYADDMVELYFAAVARSEFGIGQAFNIGGGMANSLSLLELFHFLEKELGIRISVTNLLARQSDQKVFVADISKAGTRFGWTPKVICESGLKRMLDWVRT